MKRPATYLTGAAAAIGMIIALLGWGTFDAETGMIDPAPFNIYLLAAAIPAAFAPLLAFWAWLKGWRRGP
jgi:hypothetical protein